MKTGFLNTLLKSFEKETAEPKSVKTYTPNDQRKTVVDAHKADVRARAAGFAEKCKREKRDKNATLRKLMANYGLKIREARAIYKAA